MADELSADFSGFDAMLDQIAKSPSTPAMERRIQAERAAVRTPKERARAKRVKRDVQVNLRVTKAEKALLDRLAEHLEESSTETLVQALNSFARKHKIDGGDDVA